LNIKKLQKFCWDAKPVIKDLVVEAKSLFNACVENSVPVTTVFDHFVEKVFNFVCNWEVKDIDELNNGKTCLFYSKEYESCITPYFTDLQQFTNQGICE
jgi:hypothetical protein